MIWSIIKFPSTYIVVFLLLCGLQSFAQQSFVRKVQIDNNCSYYEPHFQEGMTATWTGGQKDGFADGIGILTISINGSLHMTYEGAISMGHIQGKGKSTTSGGWVREGNFEDGNLNGYGTMNGIQSNEVSFNYHGNFVHNWMHGDGRIEYSNGDFFEGKFNMNTPYTGVFTNIKGEKKYVERGKYVSKITTKKSNYKPQIGVQQKEFFNEKWERCDLKKAKFYRLVTYKSPNWPSGKVVDYYISGVKQSTYYPVYIDYDDDLLSFSQGTTEFYYESGKLHERATHYGSCYGDTTFIYSEYGYKSGEIIYDKPGGSSVTTIYDDSGKIIRSWKSDENGALIGGIRNYETDGSYTEINRWIFGNDEEEQWKYNGKDAKSYLDGNRLRVDIKNNSYSFTRRVKCCIDQSKDYRIEAYVEQVDADDRKPYGIIFGFKDWDNYFEFLITGRKNYGFFRMSNGILTEVIPYKYSNNISWGDAMNRLDIWKIGSEFVFTINGKYVDRCDAYNLKGEELGFIASGKGEFAINDLSVNQFSKEVHISTVIPSEILGSTQEKRKRDNESSIDASGSGFAIDKRGFFATNYHVVKGAKNIYVCLNTDGIWESYNANVVINDQTNDISIIKIEDSKFRPFTSLPYDFTIAVQDVASEIFTLGYPQVQVMGTEVKYTTGVINSKSGFSGDPTHYQISAHTDFGNSGGPMFNTNGAIIGITDSGLDKSKYGDVNYAIKSSYLKSLVDALPNKLDLPNDSSIGKLSRVEQIKRLSKYTALILVDLP